MLLLLLLVCWSRTVHGVLLAGDQARHFTVNIGHAGYMYPRRLRQLVHGRNAAAHDLAKAGIFRSEHEVLLLLLLLLQLGRRLQRVIMLVVFFEGVVGSLVGHAFGELLKVWVRAVDA